MIKPRHMFYPALLLSLIFLSGCITILSNVSENTIVETDDGIIVTRIRTNVTDSAIYINKKGESAPAYTWDPVRPGENIRVVKIRQGDYFFGKILHHDGYVWSKCEHFTVNPGTIHYIGDLVVEWKTDNNSILAYILTIDRETETMAEVKEQYPWLFEKYAYEKNIMKCK
jgi:hypothetical protein